jgi:NB-ARC domain
VQVAGDPGPESALSQLKDPEGMIVRICLSIDELVPAAGLAEAPAASAPPQPVERLGDSSSRPGRLDGVPPRPPAYVERTELLTTLRSTLLEGEDGLLGITGDLQTLGLHGQGGIGKSVLAAALAHDPEVAPHFPDGIFWVALGERADLVAAQIDLLGRLGAGAAQVRTATQGVAALREALAGRRCLLIVDDVWSAAAAGAFRVAGPRGRVLYTTRDREVLRAVGARIEPVDVLPEGTARALLARLANTTSGQLPAEVDRVLAATGRAALAVALVGAAVGRGGRSWSEVAEQLERGSDTFLTHPYADIFKAMRVGLTALSREEATLYRTLAVYPEDTAVPIQAVARLWHRLRVGSGRAGAHPRHQGCPHDPRGTRARRPP